MSATISDGGRQAAGHRVPRSTIHIIAERCWQAGGHGNPRYVYLTNLDAECARQNTEYVVAYAEPVERLGGSVGSGRFHHLVVAFTGWGNKGGLAWYKTALSEKLREAWPLAAAAGIV